MKKALQISILLLLGAVLISGCTGTDQTNTPAQTNFGQMLGDIPASYFDENNLAYGAPGEARELYGLGGITSLEEYGETMQEAYLEGLQGDSSMWKVNSVGGAVTPLRRFDIYKLDDILGINFLNIDRAVYNAFPAPHTFAVYEGTFDSDLIQNKLIEQGYQETDYGDYSYFWKYDDFHQDLQSEIGNVLSNFNRIMVTDSLLITAPSTGLMTGLLDAIGEETPNLSELPSCRALADTLGDVLFATIMKRDNVPNPSSSKLVEDGFDLPAARNWDPLHLYEAAAIAFRDDGNERFFDVALYYSSQSDAEADADNLASRLESYVFFTYNNSPDFNLTDIFEVGEPVVKAYDGGATLTVSCRYRDDYNDKQGRFIPYFFALGSDLLFFAPDAVQYLTD